jgi:Reverse transcriptase (RNA-dependent DNA polymerase)
LINASFRLRYVPSLWKIAEVIMIPKPGKPPHEKSSYRPISLLPVISKLFEKLLLKRLKPIIERKKLIPTHQFGFRNNHSTIDQIHRIITIIENTLENKKVCSTVFLDVAQAFDKVWHEGLIQKLKKFLPRQFVEILQSYITDRFFRVKQEEAYSDLKEIKAGVPQGSVLGPILYLLYTCDIPELENSTIATFADDTAIMAVGNDNIESTSKLQIAINKIQIWTNKWRIKLNETKSVHVDFTNKKIAQIPVNINGQIIPYANKAKYLGMTLDVKLSWKPHVKIKKEELKTKSRKMYWLIGKNSTLSLQNKILLYKQVLRPVWTYGVQLWGCTKQSNRTMIQRSQNKILRNITNAPWYVRNSDLHRDLGIGTVEEIIKTYAKSHEERLHQHVNVEAIQLLDTTSVERRLKRLKPFDLV